MLQTIPMSQVRYRHNGHWFDASTLRWFSCRLPKTALRVDADRSVFVTSEQNTYGGGERLYTVRLQDASGDIETVGEFQGYETRRAAVRAAEAFVLSLQAAPVA